MKTPSIGWRSIKRERAIKKLKTVGFALLPVFMFSVWVAASSLERPADAKVEEEIKEIKEVKERIIVIENVTLPPVLQRIADCESDNMHYRNGEVVVSSTGDIGKFQCVDPG